MKQSFQKKVLIFRTDKVPCYKILLKSFINSLQNQVWWKTYFKYYFRVWSGYNFWAESCGFDWLGGRALWLVVQMNIKHIIKICIISGLGYRLRQILGQALRLGQDRGRARRILVLMNIIIVQINQLLFYPLPCFDSLSFDLRLFDPIALDHRSFDPMSVNLWNWRFQTVALN